MDGDCVEAVAVEVFGRGEKVSARAGLYIC
jgi:hypothetical protein